MDFEIPFLVKCILYLHDCVVNNHLSVLYYSSNNYYSQQVNTVTCMWFLKFYDLLRRMLEILSLKKYVHSLYRGCFSAKDNLLLLPLYNSYNYNNI